ncbi:STAS domain-containing protein [Actinotalea ferrariae]|uniref:STAS domain-containing protein n=1 Tax=Actinotalea ferrariae TaxID=1386098 RepID=UPI001C8B9EDA|nr:STAS domain-containing protein [Actinotalea ferrariae]MBX9245240.1 STAS domain-containing protein [Actinotalea ferrariae]
MAGAQTQDDEMSGMALVAEPDRSVVRAWGEIDLSVRRSVSELCQTVAQRALPVVIDARDVTFIDSTGMSILVRLARDAEANGYPVRLDNAPWMLRELLTITGVDQLLPLGESQAEEG